MCKLVACTCNLMCRLHMNIEGTLFPAVIALLVAHDLYVFLPLILKKLKKVGISLFFH